MEPKFVQIISEELKITKDQVKATSKLLKDGATVPFIARYRKELTGTLDEVAMAKQIEEANMALSRDELIDGLQEQDKSD